MSLAGLEEGIAQDMEVHCSGGVNLFGTYQRCWVHGGHGAVNINKAIYQSCDVFFYTLAARLGIDKMLTGRIRSVSAPKPASTSPTKSPARPLHRMEMEKFPSEVLSR